MFYQICAVIVTIANVLVGSLWLVNIRLAIKWRNEDRSRSEVIERAQLEGQMRANDIMTVQAEEVRLRVAEMSKTAIDLGDIEVAKDGKIVHSFQEGNLRPDQTTRVKDWPKSN